jgi:hypothetical protein
MEMVSHTGQGPFQAVHWAALPLLDLLVQHRTATALAVGVDDVVIIAHFIIRLQLLKVLCSSDDDSESVRANRVLNL